MAVLPVGDILRLSEGCSLIQKVGKNLYSWTGRTDNADELEEDSLEQLRVLQEDNKQLLEQERQLDK